MVAVSRALHSALADVPAPAWRSAEENPWTIGDQVAWGERDLAPLLGPAARPACRAGAAAAAVLRPVELPSQLIHADLGGNVLFDDELPPAAIDFSPLERPAGLPLAIAAVDALMWGGASPEMLEHLAGEPELDQLLPRALAYRLVTEIVRHEGTNGVDAAARAAQPVTDLVLARPTLRARTSG